MNFEFYSPWFLLLFLLFIPLLILDSGKKKSRGIAVPSIQSMQSSGNIVLVMSLLKVSKYIILTTLIIALARPRTYIISQDRDESKGIDIMLSVDVSLSMLAKDLDPDRLEALKKIATDFVTKRQNDRIGLVAYSGEAYTKVPLTTDYQVVVDELNQLNPLELKSGTAIGQGLSVAVNHLKTSKAKSKIIILMTDGVDTVLNTMPPQIAAELAKNNGIKVYTIGIGRNGLTAFPTGQINIFGDIIFAPMQTQIDENTLMDIAQLTGGKYFRATDNNSLQNIYNEIDQLEKSDVKTSKLYNYDEYFRVFLWIALAFLLLDALFRWVIFKILN